MKGRITRSSIQKTLAAPNNKRCEGCDYCRKARNRIPGQFRRQFRKLSRERTASMHMRELW